MKKWLIISTCLLFAAMGLAVPFLSTTSNCGGNSAALVYVNLISTSCTVLLMDQDAQTTLTLDELLKHEGLNNPFEFRSGVDSYWVKNEIHMNESLPVVICAQSFSNVPQPTIRNLYRKNPAHAVAYMDGRTELMSEEDFIKFDLSGYTEIREDDLKKSP